MTWCKILQFRILVEFSPREESDGGVFGLLECDTSACVKIPQPYARRSGPSLCFGLHAGTRACETVEDLSFVSSLLFFLYFFSETLTLPLQNRWHALEAQRCERRLLSSFHSLNLWARLKTATLDCSWWKEFFLEKWPNHRHQTFFFDTLYLLTVC